VKKLWRNEEKQMISWKLFVFAEVTQPVRTAGTVGSSSSKVERSNMRGGWLERNI